jgi:Phage integrase, N-terminal SAM-like domain
MQAAQAKPKLLDQLRDVLRTRHYSIRTERAYTDWVRRFIGYHRMRHPDVMGPSEVGQFLTHLAVKKNVAASTQTLARNRGRGQQNLAVGRGRRGLP